MFSDTWPMAGELSRGAGPIAFEKGSFVCGKKDYKSELVLAYKL